MKELADFFKQIESSQSQLEERITNVHRLLTSPQTHFCLVTNFDRAKLKEAEDFARDIRRSGYHLESVILNRAFPSWLQTGLDSTGLDPCLRDLYAQFQRYYAERNLALQEFTEKLRGQLPIFQLRDYLDRIYDLNGLHLVVEAFQSGELR